MDAEQSKVFNDRLSQWVESQGFWFQARYSMSHSGMKGWAMLHLLRLGFRVLIVLLVVFVGGWIYLMKRTDSAQFRKTLRENLQTGFAATELEIKGSKSPQGQLDISRLAAVGGKTTFFSALEAYHIRCKMGLLDGVVGVWNPGVVSIARLDLDIRAGADDAESAAQLAASVFRKSPTFSADTFEVANATVRWGYSERTEGGIESSTLKIQRTAAGWRLNFQGGLFHQNWLSKLEIVNLVMLCEGGGLVFEKAELKQGDGTVNFTGLRLTGGERPQAHGTVKIRHIALDKILPAALTNFLEGSLSGDFQVFGSTNSSEGIGFEGQVVMDGKDVITLREQIHLLKALSVVDFARNYHRIDFREGSFQMKTTGGGLELSQVKMKAEDLLTLDGSLKVRLPTQAEIQAAVGQGFGIENSPVFTGDNPSIPGREDSKKESDFTLKRAAQEARRIKEGTQSPDSLSLFDRLNLSFEMRRLQNQTSERMSRMLRYEGLFQITLPRNAFERGPQLQKLYPADPITHRVSMKVPLEGPIYELTLKQAEEIYEQGRR